MSTFDPITKISFYNITLNGDAMYSNSIFGRYIWPTEKLLAPSDSWGRLASETCISFQNFKISKFGPFQLYRLPACFVHIHRITDCIKGAEARKLLVLFNGYWLQISSDMTLNIRSQVTNNGAMVSIIRRRRQILNIRRHRPFPILPRN